MLYEKVAVRLEGTGLKLRGAARLEEGEWPLSDTSKSARTVILVGNYGGELWPQFSATAPASDNPMDDWTKSVIRPLAAKVGGHAIFPSDKPYAPFLTWALRAEPVFSSPLGMLIHSEHGLWHAYRAALLFAEVIDIPGRPDGHSPCVTCETKPCLRACPVDAFGGEGLDTGRCMTHLRSSEQTCMSDGCRARAACPVARDRTYPSEQVCFHMDAYFRSRMKEAAGGRQ